MAMTEKQLIAWHTPDFIMQKLREFDIDWDTAYTYITNFLDGKIGFMDIPALIRQAMDAHHVKQYPSVSEILETEAEVYEFLKNK